MARLRYNKTKKKLRILLEGDGIRTVLGKVIDRIKARKRKVVGFSLVSTSKGVGLGSKPLRVQFQRARAAAAEAASELGEVDLAKRILIFQFRDIHPKAASELPLEHASKLLGHTQQQITQRVYRPVGEI
ncbi:hypothetical protein OK116_07310 [Xylella fastidiosa subsp. fastidiosa]|jgi:integrase|uniref:hypothetical protein n=1 Tax=Xylella fastidiosa TaxID=2371 RepID=UPI00091BC08E|nr:hypothetical protein [Xylella fastidiosa]UIT49338.1 hypothetical protein LZ752_07135 [Xylella fastidiosa subsp. fastidiosa]UIT51487.1 hypothetical protein LZ753_07055 [Xylella fastidiosa subsp. fastidiosa]WCF15278.1 hypothetical protein OK115_01520 [Xylella fastidiosa subsp. fastidiosa]WCF16550.1 hypothetical protein OK116_07310 [Xylella fastidiosa subsp. fastidiosa]WCF18736.1 hypothetical protein OK118_07110 [Xylella fastidiosa subsp. fastidiosa]